MGNRITASYLENISSSLYFIPDQMVSAGLEAQASVNIWLQMSGYKDIKRAEKF